jgi:hypothetical protein
MSSDRGGLRWSKVILIPALAGLLTGFLLWYAFPAKYTSQALVLVEAQKVSEDIVQPLITEDRVDRIGRLEQQVLGRNRRQPLPEQLGLTKPGQNIDDLIDDTPNVTSEALRAYMYTLRDGRCFLAFNWFQDFPKGGQGIGGVSNGWNYVTGYGRSKTSTS